MDSFYQKRVTAATRESTCPHAPTVFEGLERAQEGYTVKFGRFGISHGALFGELPSHAQAGGFGLGF
jgi:hypothetical protein